MMFYTAAVNGVFAFLIAGGLLQNSTNAKNEIDFPQRDCLSHFLQFAFEFSTV